VGLLSKDLKLDINYNVDELRAELEKLTPAIYDNHKTEGFQVIKRYLEIVRNITLLSVNKIGVSADSGYELARHKGKVEVISDALATVEKIINDYKLRPEKKGKPKKTRSYTRQEHVAGAADY
jgi:hypothetical protein